MRRPRDLRATTVSQSTSGESQGYRVRARNYDVTARNIGTGAEGEEKKSRVERREESGVDGEKK